MRPHLTSTTLLALTLLLHPTTTHAQPAPQTPPLPYLDVTGHGAAFAPPDTATIDLGAFFIEPTVSEAQSKVNRAVAAAISAIKALDIPAAAITTDTISISPEYDRQRRYGDDDKPPPQLVGYRAANSLSIRLEDISQAGPVIDAALKAGANRLHDLAFGLKDPTPQHTEALRRAVADARHKADTIADAMNLTITGVAEVIESTRSSEGGGGRSYFSQVDLDVETPIEPGQITVAAAVFIRFHIAPKQP